MGCREEVGYGASLVVVADANRHDPVSLWAKYVAMQRHDNIQCLPCRIAYQLRVNPAISSVEGLF
jgi:hypothetical protein